MTDYSDHELHARFDTLRGGDEQRAPGFRSVLERPVRLRPRRSGWALRVALSIAAALLLSVGLVRLSRRRAFVAEPLSTWRSPTSDLLRTTGSDLLRSSALMPSMLDQLVSVSLAHKEK